MSTLVFFIWSIVSILSLADRECISTSNLEWKSYNNQIYLNGNKFDMKGLSWFGFETDTYIVHGLGSWAGGGHSYSWFFDMMINNGFNAIRLPFSQEMIENNPVIGSWQYDASGNSIFNDKTALEAYDIIIQQAADRGIWIMLDFHSVNANSFRDGFWDLNQGKGISIWQTLADRYKNEWNIFMIDIYNEPHDVTNSDWSQWINYCQNVAQALLSKGVNWLFMVQGTNSDCTGGACNWGENLQSIRNQGVTMEISQSNRVVFSPHVYGPDIASNPYGSSVWTEHWGYLGNGDYPSNKAAVIIGEFGTKYDTSEKEKWLNSLISYLISINQRNTYFWCLNANSGDTGGLLQSDWTTLESDKLNKLDQLQPTPSTTTYNIGEICINFGTTDGGGSDGEIESFGGKCLDIHQPDLNTNGGKVQIWECNNAIQQIWSYDSSNGKIKSGGGKCLDVHYDDYISRINGATVQIWECKDGYNNQKWSINGNQIISSNGKCLDVDLPQLHDDGGLVHLWDCVGSDNQLWTV